MKRILSRRRALVGLAVLLVLAGFGLWSWRSHAQMAKVRQLQQELFSDAARAKPPEERRQLWEVLNREQQKLSSTQRRQLFDESRQRREKELERYFTLSPAEKTKWLDAQINREEAARKARAANTGQARGGPPSGATVAARSPSGNRGPRPPSSPEDRERRRKARLDDSTPEQRARRDQLAKDMQARRTQRGLPASTFGFGGSRLNEKGAGRSHAGGRPAACSGSSTARPGTWKAHGPAG